MKVLKWLDEHLESYLLVLISAVMVSVIALQVFMRFVLNSSLTWSEELARYCFVWLIYIGISYGVKKQRHIKVDIALILLKDKGKIVLNLIANAFFLFFALFVVFYGYEVAQSLLKFGQKSPSLGISMGIVYLATPIGMGLTAIRLLQQIVQQIKALLGKGNYRVKTEQDLILDEE